MHTFIKHTHSLCSTRLLNIETKLGIRIVLIAGSFKSVVKQQQATVSFSKKQNHNCGKRTLPFHNTLNNLNAWKYFEREYVKTSTKSTMKTVQIKTDTLHYSLHASKTTRSDLIGRLHLAVGQWGSSQDAVVKGRDNRIFKNTPATNRKRARVSLTFE